MRAPTKSARTAATAVTCLCYYYRTGASGTGPTACSQDDQLGDYSRPLHGNRAVPIDAHVHFHRVEFVERTLDAAAANFGRVTSPSGRFAGLLLLAESAREQVFAELAKRVSCGRWTIRSLPAEPQTVVASLEDNEIAVVCGRQVRCEGGLEVLALGTTTRYPEGEDVGATIERVLHDGTVAVFPWGFGKWMGRARQTVESVFSASRKGLFAGDNGGRLQLLGLPAQLRAAGHNGYRVLPGTDPFPFGGDYRRVGSFGFLAHITPEATKPWQSVRDWLNDEQTVPEPYGRALGPFRFVANQSWIQVRNRVVNRRAR